MLISLDAWFYWSDGTEVTYTRWDKQANQPGSGISPNCVVMRLQGAYVGSFGYWYDGYDCETWGSPVTVCKTGTGLYTAYYYVTISSQLSYPAYCLCCSSLKMR